MGSKIKPRQSDRRPKRFIPDYAPEKGASNARRAQRGNFGKEEKRQSNRQDWKDYER